MILQGKSLTHQRIANHTKRTLASHNYEKKKRSELQDLTPQLRLYKVQIARFKLRIVRKMSELWDMSRKSHNSDFFLRIKTNLQLRDIKSELRNFNLQLWKRSELWDKVEITYLNCISQFWPFFFLAIVRQKLAIVSYKVRIVR